MVVFIITVSSVLCCTLAFVPYEGNENAYAALLVTLSYQSQSPCGIKGSEGNQLSVRSIPNIYFYIR